MAIEDDDIRDREVWTSVARHWYVISLGNLQRISSELCLTLELFTFTLEYYSKREGVLAIYRS